MAYEKQTWVNNETVIDKDKMDHIEDGIYDTDASVTEVKNDLTAFPTIQFGNAGSLTCVAGEITELEVTFPEPFNATPLVFLSMMTTSSSANMGLVSLMCANVTSTGFTYRVANADTSSRTPALRWLAIR